MKTHPCPLCGLRVKLEDRRLADHAGWDGEPCKGSGKTPMEALNEAQS